MLRPAAAADIPRMLELCQLMQAESPHFSKFAWSTPKMEKLLAWLIDSLDGLAMLYEQDGEIVGGFLGIITEQFFSEDRFAQDFGIFVVPDQRGRLAGRELIEAFKEWAKLRNVPAVLGVSTGVNIEGTGRLLEACGFERFGYLYEFNGGVSNVH